MSKDIEALERLARLRESGVLTDEELQIEKAKLLGERPALSGRSASTLVGKGWEGTWPPRAVIVGIGTASIAIVLAVAGYRWVQAETRPSDAAVSSNEPAALAEEWIAADEACRGGAGDDPATERACAQRDTLGAGLVNAGWCEANGSWALCRRGSSDAPLETPITDKPLLVISGAKVLEIGTARTLAEAYRIRVGWTCKEVDMGEDRGIACRDPTSPAGLDMFFGTVSSQGQFLISAGRLRDRNGTGMDLQGEKLVHYLVNIQTTAGVLVRQ